MESYLKQLIAIQQQVNGLVEEIQSHMLREKIGAGPPIEGPKKRGRPPKAVAATVAEPATEPDKPKRVLSDEHKQKLREGRERAKAARDAEKAAAILAAAEEAVEAAEAPAEEKEAPVEEKEAPVEEKEAPTEDKSDAVSVVSTETKPKKRILLRKPATKPSEADIYKYMFELQESGVCNMLGSGEYLRKRFSSMTAKEAEDIVLNYMSNYDELFAKYG